MSLHITLIFFSVSYNFSCPKSSPLNNEVKINMNSCCIYSNYANLSDELEHVKSSREMKEFLQHQIQCHVQIFEYQVDDILTSNISNNLNSIFFPQLCETCNDTYKDIAIFYFKNYHIIQFFIIAFAIISLLGNGITIIHEIQTLIKLKDMPPDAKEKKLYKILVSNLCFADLLMAIYILTLSITELTFERISSDLCNTIGVISVLSMQASVSILVIITGYRLHGVLFPFKHVDIKLAVCLLVFVWIAWIVVVSLPLFNESLFAFEFTREIESNSVDGEKSFTEHITKVTRTVQHLASAINATDDLFSQVLVTANKFQTNEVAVQVLKSFNLVNFEQNTNLVNCYFSKSACTMDFLIDARNTTTTYFSLFLLSFDLVCYLYILIANLIILRSISKLCFLSSFFPCLSLRNFFEKQERTAPKAINENKQVYVRILIIIVTDLICGIAICLIGLGHYFQGLVSDCSHNRSYGDIATPFIMMLFPLNSVINPYIYSFHLWKAIYRRCKQRLRYCKFYSFANS